MNEWIPVAPEGYALVRTIGRGASSVVWEARALATDTSVALKILETDVAGIDALRTFARERDAMNALAQHPNILTILAADVHDGRPWIAMELCRRGSLSSYVADGGPLEVPTVLRVLERLAGALQVAHQAGVVHCDIKPANVMLTDEGEPALGDFGIARVAVSASTTTTGAAFTLDHVAPELLDDGRRSPRSDIYSLGTTAWQLLVGVPPFRGTDDVSVGTVLTRILRRPLPESELVPDDVLALLRRMTAKDPEDRPASMAEVSAAVRALAEERGVDLDAAALPPLTSVQLALIEIMSDRVAPADRSEPALTVTGGGEAADAPPTYVGAAGDGAPAADPTVIVGSAVGPTDAASRTSESAEGVAAGLAPSMLVGVPLEDSTPPRVMPIYTRRPSSPQAASDRSRRVPFVAASVVALLVAAGLAFGLNRSAPAEPPAPAPTPVAVEAPVTTTPTTTSTTPTTTTEPTTATSSETSSAQPAPRTRRTRATTTRRTPRRVPAPVPAAPAPPPVAQPPVTTDEPKPNPKPPGNDNGGDDNGDDNGGGGDTGGNPGGGDTGGGDTGGGDTGGGDTGGGDTGGGDTGGGDTGGGDTGGGDTGGGNTGGGDTGGGDTGGDTGGDSGSPASGGN